MSLVEYIVDKMKLSPTKHKIAVNVAWSLLGKIVALLGGLLVGIVVARFLGPEKYGMMNYVISFVTIFQIISTFGLDNIEVREEAKEGADVNVIIGTSFVIRIIFAVITMAATIITSLIFESDIYTTIYVAVYSFSIIFRTFDVIRNRFTSLVQNEYVVKAEISRTLIGICVKLFFLWISAELIWFIFASAFDYFLLSGGYIVSYKRKLGKIRQWKFDKKYALFLIKEAFPLLLTSAAVFIYQRIDQVMIGNMVDNEAVGYFATASRFVEILMFVPQIITHTVAPVLVKVRQDSPSQYTMKAQLFMNFTVWSMVVLALMLSVSSYWIISLTFGEKYMNAVPILAILAFKAPAFALSTTAGNMLVIEGLQKYAIIRDLFGCIVCISLNYLMLPQYGTIAASYIAILSYLCAGYLGDIIVPAYRHIFLIQTKTILTGWKDLINFKKIFK